jgi:hypothetical protein
MPLSRSVKPPVGSQIGSRTHLGYSHTLIGQTSAAIEGLQGLPLSSKDSQKEKATGTDDRDVTTDCAYRPADRKLTGKAYSDKTGMSLVGTVGKMESDSSGLCNSGTNCHLDTACPPMSSKNQTEQEGFEPSEPFGSMVFKTIAISHSATAPEAHFVQVSLRFYSILHEDQGFFDKTRDFHRNQAQLPLANALFLDYK